MQVQEHCRKQPSWYLELPSRPSVKPMRSMTMLNVLFEGLERMNPIVTLVALWEVHLRRPLLPARTMTSSIVRLNIWSPLLFPNIVSSHSYRTVPSVKQRETWA
eukprot:8904614-Pyramimonas_sp.AAC.1